MIYCTQEFETVPLPFTLRFQLLYVIWPYFTGKKMRKRDFIYVDLQQYFNSDIDVMQIELELVCYAQCSVQLNNCPNPPPSLSPYSTPTVVR